MNIKKILAEEIRKILRENENIPSDVTNLIKNIQTYYKAKLIKQDDSTIILKHSIDDLKFIHYIRGDYFLTTVFLDGKKISAITWEHKDYNFQAVKEYVDDTVQYVKDKPEEFQEDI